jgi:hypothetical protein
VASLLVLVASTWISPNLGWGPGPKLDWGEYEMSFAPMMGMRIGIGTWMCKHDGMSLGFYSPAVNFPLTSLVSTMVPWQSIGPPTNVLE